MSKVDQVIAAASAELGEPYVWGDEGPNTFDCSGLMQWVFAKVGLRLPRTARQQQAWATPVTGTPQPGDLVFWGRPATHVGLYIGGGKMIAASSSADKVRVQAVYGRPAGYGRVKGLGAGVAAVTEPVADAAGGLAGKLQGLLTGVRANVLEWGVAAAGATLIGIGLWRTVRPAVRESLGGLW